MRANSNAWLRGDWVGNPAISWPLDEKQLHDLADRQIAARRAELSLHIGGSELTPEQRRRMGQYVNLLRARALRVEGSDAEVVGE